MKKQLLVWCFVVTVAASLVADDAIDTKVKNAVDGLAKVLIRQMEVNIETITPDGTRNMPSSFSLYLYNKVQHHAANNALFKVVAKQRGPRQDWPSTGIISGTYNRTKDIVEVYLRLVIDGTIHGSQPFAVSMEELEQLGISILPDNFITTEETGQGIHIQAWFEKESRTYYHRDELKMTVMADKNCYFKIIHIDANSQMKMIYPNSYSTNNQLTVNTPRVIFENESVGYMLYEPYGTEVIQLVASTEQFKDIEQEYIIPRRTATSEIIRPEVVESRGGDLEATGEAKYIITVLKPHEEYEFKKPSNMTEAIEALRSDALRQGGVFEGNEQSGYYTMNGVRGSYRILAPDTLQMAVYYPDNHTGGPDTGIWRRGSGFNFSFERPANISQAVQAVRSGIEDKGGTFTGNEQQGSFKASGIAGQYRVSEMVNVTITEKPFIVPNSLIEKEVRNYFIGSEKR